MTGQPMSKQRLREPVCLRCQSSDQLASVAAVVRDGRSTSVVHARVLDRSGYAVPIRARVARTSDLAQELATPQLPRPATSWAVALGVSGLLAAWNLQGALNGGGSTAWFGAVAFAVTAGACGALLRVRGHQTRVARPMAEGAVWLWRRSWYCHRCGVVSVLTPNGSAVVGAGRLGASLVDLSRETRWGRGSQISR